MNYMVRNVFKEQLLVRGITETEIGEAIKNVEEITRRNIQKLGGEFPWMTTKQGIYEKSENRPWTCGFWPGILWLLSEISKDKCFENEADRLVKSFNHRIVNKISVANHDIGFLYTLSCVAAYQLTGSALAKETILLAADHLITMFREKGNYIDAWGNVSNVTAERNFYIIDSLMNVPLLRKASEISGDNKYRDIADRHVNTVRNTIFREDGSTYHRALFSEDGSLLRCDTVQGNSENSCWTRGQAWGIYGFAIDYAYTKNEASKDCFKKVTDYFIAHLPEDRICYWDFDFISGTEEPRDSSAAAIAACGLLEMYEHLPDGEERENYINVALDIIASLIRSYSVKANMKEEGLILHGTGSKPHDIGVDECTIWGDYYYLEALVRIIKKWDMYW